MFRCATQFSGASRIQRVRYFASSGPETKPNHTCEKHHPLPNNNKSGTDAEPSKVTSAKQSNKASAKYCFELVRKHDYENFLCTLLLPNEKSRREMFAIRAFNTEVALIRDQVSQKELGLGRLFFWKDALNQLYLNKQSSTQHPYVPKHPVVIELNHVINGNSVSKKWLTNLLESRERLMADTPFKDMPELEAYCDQSVTSMMYLAFELIGVKNVEVDHAASHLGKAVGLSNFIRSIPFNAQRRRILIPHDILIKNKVSQENFVRNNEKEGIQEVVYEIACYAHSHYEKAKSMKQHVNKTLIPFFLSGVPSLLYLSRLQKANFNPYDPSLQRRNGLLPFHLFYKKLSRSYY